MDEYLFSEHLARLKALPEPTSCLEILNYSDPQHCFAKTRALSSDEFEDFLDRKGSFSPDTEQPNSHFYNGIRLVVQFEVQKPETFASNVVSLDVDKYESLIRKMRLPFQGLEASSAVGPFFWWCLDTESSNPQLQLIFRKSDAQWRGKTRGWELMLTYCFRTNITSGYIRGTKCAEIRHLLHQLTACSRPCAHPLLLPVLILHHFSSKNDEDQRAAREKIRELEGAISQRYRTTSDAASTLGNNNNNYGPEKDIDLDSVNQQLTDCQCKVLQKNPLAWRNALDRLERASHAFWQAFMHHSQQKEREAVTEPERELQTLHRCMLSRLDFIAGKLAGIENYAHVSLERLKSQREVMLSILDQRESRLSLRIAAQQHRLADASKRDSTSMKTLTFLGSMFLPGTFISSVFSMSFFDFSKDLQHSVSSDIWLYFALMVPLTIFFMGVWWRFDRAREKIVDEEKEDGDEVHMQVLENHIIKELQKRTGARLSWKTDRSLTGKLPQ